jgi:branched-chain amino acid aminotransferase
MKMQVEKRLLPPDKLKSKPTDESKLGFGTIFSDHMLRIDYKPGKGWHNARIEAYGPIALDPAAMVLHYGQEVFEGMKAYIGKTGEACMFRPAVMYERMLASSRRLCIPDFSVDEFLAATYDLIKIEKGWIPKTPGTSLYVRPNLIAVDPYVGVRPSMDYLFYVIVGPVGAYYPEGFNPVKIFVEEKYIRAAPGGLGEAKTGANYAASLLAAEEAKHKGYTQVLWLDARSKKAIEEVGTMNIFFKIRGAVVTPELSGAILPGVTRDSILQLCRHWNIQVEERTVTIDEVLKAHDDGVLEEVFGTGTAAIISPVGEMAYRNKQYKIADGKTGPLSQKLYDEIVGIQLGQRPDPFGWVVTVG